MKRLFIAFNIILSEDTKVAYSEIRQTLHSGKINWVPDHQCHITLKFLGETPAETVPSIINIMDHCLPVFASFEVILKGVGIFGNLRDPKVLWMGCHSGDIPLKIKNELEQKLEGLGFMPDSRPFSPHLTLGRIKHLGQDNRLSMIIDNFRDTVFQKQEISTIKLYESKLTATGPIYSALNITNLR